MQTPLYLILVPSQASFLPLSLPTNKTDAGALLLAVLEDDYGQHYLVEVVRFFPAPASTLINFMILRVCLEMMVNRDNGDTPGRLVQVILMVGTKSSTEYISILISFARVLMCEHL